MGSCDCNTVGSMKWDVYLPHVDNQGPCDLKGNRKENLHPQGDHHACADDAPGGGKGCVNSWILESTVMGWSGEQ